MAIKALGESLLSSAKKKAKRGQKLGQLAGLAMIGMSIANSNIRKKAMTRYNEWNNSLTPIKKALDENLLESGRVEAEYKKRSGHAGGELQSFIDAKFEMLKKAGGTVPSGQPQPSDQEYLAIAKKEALPEFKEYRERVEAYQDIFGIKDDEYYKQYNRLNKLTTAELKNDNLMELLGNRTGWGKDTSQVATEIMLANNRSATLNIPANILAQFDTEYFDELSAMAQRTAKTQKVRKERLLSLSEQSKNRDSKVLLELVTPKRSSAVKIDEQINKAWSTISEKFIGEGRNIKDNTDYIGDLKFVDKQFEDEYTVADLLDELAKINSKTQEPIKDTEINAISNEDFLINTAKELAQFEKEKFMATGSGVVDDIMYKGWMKEGFQKALAGVVVEELNVPYWFDKKIIKLKYEEDTPPPPPDETPVPIVLLRNKIAEYQDNPMGMPSGVLKDIQRIVEELPEYKDEFSVYLPEEDEETPPPSPTPAPTPSPTPAPTPAPTTSKSLLSMDEEEVMSSAAADKAREEAAAIPGQVVTGVSDFVDAKILENLEEIVVKMKDGKPAIGTSTARVATWLKNTKNISYYKLSKEERIEAIEEYIETLKS